MISAPIIPEVGQRVGVECGPGEFARDNAGTVIERVTDRWGTHALVKMDRGDTVTCHGMNRGRGIGWHYVQDEAAPASAALQVGQTYSINGTNLQYCWARYSVDAGQLVHFFSDGNLSHTLRENELHKFVEAAQ